MPKLFRKESKKPSKTQIFYPDEIDQICDECFRLAHETSDETYLAIPLFFLTGIRIGELLGLGFDDFNNIESSLYIHRSFCMEMELLENGSFSSRHYEIQDHLKLNAEPRIVKVPEQVFEIEKKIRLLHMKKGTVRNFLFQVTTPHAKTGKLYSICENLGIARRSPHKCRKTYISNLFNNKSLSS